MDILRANLSFQNLNIAAVVFQSSTSNTVITQPKNVNSALKAVDAPEWRTVIRTEFQVLFDKGTFRLLHSIPDGFPVLGTSVKLKVKWLADGSLDKRKARLVAYGQEQEYEFNYWDTHAPAASIESFRIFLEFVVFFYLFVTHFDVVAAFVNSDLEDEIYVVPQGLPCPRTPLCKVAEIYLWSKAGCPRLGFAVK